MLTDEILTIYEPREAVSEPCHDCGHTRYLVVPMSVPEAVPSRLLDAVAEGLRAQWGITRERPVAGVWEFYRCQYCWDTGLSDRQEATE